METNDLSIRTPGKHNLAAPLHVPGGREQGLSTCPTLAFPSPLHVTPVQQSSSSRRNVTMNHWLGENLGVPLVLFSKEIW